MADKRSIANAIQVFFKDGTATEKIEVEYPIGHRRRRKEGIPLLVEKFKNTLQTRFAPSQANGILELSSDPSRLNATSVSDFMEHFVAKGTR